MQLGLKKSLCASLLIVIASSTHAEYTVGDGFETGNVFLSGYSKVAWEAPTGKPQSLILDDLSFFASVSVNQYINPFIEAEITKAQFWQEGDGIGFKNSKLVLERLYNDVLLNDQVTLRIGKSLAPVGEWNRIHAAPLVWTTNRPITTRYSFSESVSGVNLQYTQQNNNVFHLYYQPGSEWVPKPNDKNRPRDYEQVAGVSFDNYLSLENKLGFSVQHADVKNSNVSQWVFSLDGQWKNTQFDIEYQTTYAKINYHSVQSNSEEWGGYIQGIWHFNDQWHAIVRPEYFLTRQNDSQTSMLYGLVYRPQPAISFKLEYVDINLKQSFGFSQGLFASMAVLF